MSFKGETYTGRIEDINNFHSSPSEYSLAVPLDLFVLLSDGQNNEY